MVDDMNKHAKFGLHCSKLGLYAKKCKTKNGTVFASTKDNITFKLQTEKGFDEVKMKWTINNKSITEYIKLGLFFQLTLEDIEKLDERINFAQKRIIDFVDVIETSLYIDIKRITSSI